jgi:SAM-dependent methyltransferase
MATLPYTKEYYEVLRNGSLRSAEVVVPLILGLVEAKSVVDVGCGDGTWLSVFRKSGIADVLGLDGEYVRDGLLHIPRECFLATNLEKAFAIERRFDLAVSLEVAEHLPSASAASFVESLTRLAPVVMFSAAIPFQGGNHHINEQWPSYWSEIFLRCEFMPIDLRGRFWDDPDIEWWYRQNMLLFVRKDSLGRFAHASQPPLDIVHPNHPVYAAYERPTLGFLFRSLPGAVARSFRARLLGKLGR